MTLRRWITTAGTALVLGLTAVGCAAPEDGPADAGGATTSVTTASETSGTTAPETAAELDATRGGDATAAPDGERVAAGSALATLETLEVKGRAPKTGYDREQFGPRWADVDHNGCDTRNDILARDLEFETFRPGTNDCVVVTGVLHDPYTATEIHFERGQDTSSLVQIDHVVALSDAWQKGAQQLDEATRTAFANDPLNLLAVDGSANSQKGDGDAATWLPANRAFRCDYVARQIAVKDRYTLWVTSAEKDAMARVLSTCPDQELPTDGTAAAAYEIETRETQSAPPAPEAPAAEAPAAPAPAPVIEEQVQIPEATGTDPRFGTCREAKAAGYGPYVSGVDPEYAWYRDGDGDGTNCE